MASIVIDIVVESYEKGGFGMSMLGMIGVSQC